jgi:DNA-directed RNA polymerase
MDFRGRIYNYCHILSYQNFDLIRSLINFYDEGTLNHNNVDYLIMYITSLIGLSKETMEHKRDWVINNIDRLNTFNDITDNWDYE